MKTDKSRMHAWRGILALIAVVVILGVSPDAEALRKQQGNAVINLKTGWTQQLVYQHQLVFPSIFAIHESDSVLVGDPATLQVHLLQADGTLQPYADLSSAPGGLRTIAYQRGKARMLVFGGDENLYAYGSDGQYTLLATLSGFYVGSVAVASDDSLYIFGVDGSGGSFRHFDADGKSEKILASVQSTSALIALDDTNHRLYFSDAFAGTVNELDVSAPGNVPVVIASGVGIPGTSEPVAVAVAGDGHLYVYPLGGGLSRYDPSATPTWQFIMSGTTGGGPFIWSPAHAAFLQGHLGGANVVAYDPASKTISLVTKPFNARAVVETDEGKCLVCVEAESRHVLVVSNTGFKDFTDELPGDCATLERDPSGTIYLGLGDGQIMTVSSSGKTSPWARIAANGAYVTSYDVSNAALVTMKRTAGGSQITRIFKADPLGAGEQFDLPDISADAGAVDDQGNIYVLDVQANTVSRVANGSQAADLFVTGVLSSAAIGAPAMEFLSVENALVVSTITNYELWPLANPVRQVLADNAGGVDNLTVSETKDRGVVAVHSGRAFRLIPPGKVLITSIKSKKASPGTSAKIIGSGFASDKSKDTVYFGMRKAKIKRATATSISVTIPNKLRKGIVTVYAVVNGVESNRVQVTVK